MNMTRDEEWLLREKYEGDMNPSFVEDCARLRAGEPLAYVIGHVPFLGVTVYLDSRPLIPRAETEFWVERAIAEMPSHEPIRVLDLCSGSGAIGLAVLAKRLNASVDLIELEERHHATIERNLRENGVSASRARVLGDDLFERAEGPYDHILSNPPYIDPALDRVAQSVRAFEPAEALYGGEGGLELVRRIMREAKGFLAPYGRLYIEHEPEQSAAIATAAKEAGLACRTERDQYGVDRYSVLSCLAPRFHVESSHG